MLSLLVVLSTISPSSCICECVCVWFSLAALFQCFLNFFFASLKSGLLSVRYILSYLFCFSTATADIMGMGAAA